MFQQSRWSRYLLWAVLHIGLVLLVGCGGGGSSSSSPSEHGPPLPPQGMEQSLPPSLTGYEGPPGELLLQAEGNRGPVTIGYRPLGQGMIDTVIVGPDEQVPLSLAVGVAPDLHLVSVPEGQHCELSVDWQFQVMPWEDAVSIACGELLVTPQQLHVYPLQWVALPGVELAQHRDGLRAQLTMAGSVPVSLELTVRDDALVFLVPDLISGTGELQVWFGDAEPTIIPIDVAPIPELDVSTFMANWWARLDDVGALLDGDALASWRQHLAQKRGEIEPLFAALSALEQVAVVRYLWANLTAAEEALHEPVMLARSAARLLPDCGMAVIGLASYTAVHVLAAVGVAELTGLLTLTGPAAVVGVLLGGVAVAAILSEAVDGSRLRARKAVQICADYRGLVSGGVHDFDIMPQVAAKSGPAVITTTTLRLAHEQPYQSALRVRRVLPAELTQRIRGLQSALQPISGFFGERLDWLYLFDFDARLPLKSAQLSVSGAHVKANTLVVQNSLLSVELAVTGEPEPDRLLPFRLAGSGEATDTWLGETLPVNIDLRGHLSGRKPLAFDVTLDVAPGDALRFTVPVEFATSTMIVTQAARGNVFHGDELAEYYYFPNDGFVTDQFQYRATNNAGSAEGTVTFRLMDQCQRQNSTQIACTYVFRDVGRMFKALAANDEPMEQGGVQSWRVFSMHTLEGELLERHAVYHYRHEGEPAGGNWVVNRAERVVSSDNGQWRSSMIDLHQGLDGSILQGHAFLETEATYSDQRGVFFTSAACTNLPDYQTSSRSTGFSSDDPLGVREEFSNEWAESLVYCPTMADLTRLVPLSPTHSIDAASVYRYFIR